MTQGKACEGPYCKISLLYRPQQNLPVQVREGVQSGLQEAVGAEHVASVRQGVCGAIAVIARTAVPGGQWPGLLPWLHGCTQSANEEHREVALVLLCSLTDTIGAQPPPCPPSTLVIVQLVSFEWEDWLKNHVVDMPYLRGNSIRFIGTMLWR